MAELFLLSHRHSPSTFLRTPPLLQRQDGKGPQADGKVRSGPFTIHQATGQVAGYGKVTMSCVFAPLEVGHASLDLTVSYKATGQRRLVIPPGGIKLQVRARGGRGGAGGPTSRVRSPLVKKKEGMKGTAGRGRSSSLASRSSLASPLHVLPQRFCELSSLTHSSPHTHPPHALSSPLQGQGRDVPIFLESSVLDFKCSMFDHVYRNYLRIRNGGKTAMKVNVVNRPDVSDYFEFSPDFGFAQVGGSLRGAGGGSGKGVRRVTG
jgi:hypothetical protein